MRQSVRPNPWLGAAIATGLTLYKIAAEREDRRWRDARGRDPLGRRATQPTDIPKRGWWQTLKRVWDELGADNISHIAAGVGFYALLAIFPAFAALIALYGLVADPVTVAKNVETLSMFLPAEALKILTDALNKLVTGSQTKLGIGLFVSVGLALWSARVGTGALMTSLNMAYGESEKRNFIWFNLAALALTLVLVLFGIVAIVTVAVIPVALKFLPLPEAWVGMISAVRWPILGLMVMVMLSIIYRFAPSREKPRWRWVSPGAVVATFLWVIGSAFFSLYVSRFGSYDQTYGSLGAVIVLLLWFWLSAYTILIGAELNAELEHQTARDTTTGAEKPLGQRGARMADTVAPAT
jgi:membrane protein